MISDETALLGMVTWAGAVAYVVIGYEGSAVSRAASDRSALFTAMFRLAVVCVVVAAAAIVFGLINPDRAAGDQSDPRLMLCIFTMLALLVVGSVVVAYRALTAPDQTDRPWRSHNARRRDVLTGFTVAACLGGLVLYFFGATLVAPMTGEFDARGARIAAMGSVVVLALLGGISAIAVKLAEPLDAYSPAFQKKLLKRIDAIDGKPQWGALRIGVIDNPDVQICVLPALQHEDGMHYMRDVHAHELVEYQAWARGQAINPIRELHSSSLLTRGRPSLGSARALRRLPGGRIVRLKGYIANVRAGEEDGISAQTKLVRVDIRELNAAGLRRPAE